MSDITKGNRTAIAFLVVPPFKMTTVPDLDTTPLTQVSQTIISATSAIVKCMEQQIQAKHK